MALVWLCATPCGATGPVPGGPVVDPVARPAAVRADAPAEVSLPALPALRRGAVALVLAMAVVAAVSAGDARATGGASTVPASTVSAASSAPAVQAGERPVPGRRDLA